MAPTIYPTKATGRLLLGRRLPSGRAPPRRPMDATRVQPGTHSHVCPAVLETTAQLLGSSLSWCLHGVQHARKMCDLGKF